MENGTIKIHDVVALVKAHSERSLVRGQVGTVVEVLSPTDFEVEFSDNEGRTYAELALPGSELIVLHHQPVAAA